MLFSSKDINGNTIETLAVTASSTSAQAVVTSATPVTVTNPLGPAPPTVYSYTTVDGNGNTEVIVDTFTPTYQPTVYPTSYLPGTILAWSDFTSLYMTATSKSNASSQAPFTVGAAALWSSVATVMAMGLGVRLVGLL